jgi:hypothetical protein
MGAKNPISAVVTIPNSRYRIAAVPHKLDKPLPDLLFIYSPPYLNAVIPN